MRARPPACKHWHLAYVPRQQPKVERVLWLGGLGCQRGRYVHVEAHQLLVLSFARVQTDDNVARQLLDREAVRREAGPVARARREHADGVGVGQRPRLDDVEGHVPNLGKGTEAGLEDVVREPLEAAERARRGARIGGGVLDGRENALRQRAVVDRAGDVVVRRGGAQIVRDVHAGAHGLPHGRGRRRGPLRAVRDVREEEQVADSDGVLRPLSWVRRVIFCLGGGGHRLHRVASLFSARLCPLHPWGRVAAAWQQDDGPPQRPSPPESLQHEKCQGVTSNLRERRRYLPQQCVAQARRRQYVSLIPFPFRNCPRLITPPLQAGNS